MLLATSQAVYDLAVVLVVAAFVVPFYLAWRIGRPKGRAWFWYALFLSWIGVLILAFLGPSASARSTVGSGTYHVPPGVARQNGRKAHWMYEKRSGRKAA